MLFLEIESRDSSGRIRTHAVRTELLNPTGPGIESLLKPHGAQFN